MDNISVCKARLRMGKKLANKIQEKWGNEQIDVVIPIPDTSRGAFAKDERTDAIWVTEAENTITWNHTNSCISTLHSFVYLRD
jgi:glutamine phosphoribosylpyrophosphate amidotransferase